MGDTFLNVTITKSGRSALKEYRNPTFGTAAIICKPDGTKPQAVYTTPIDKKVCYAVIPIQKGYYEIVVRAKPSHEGSLCIRSATVYQITEVNKGRKVVPAKVITSLEYGRWSDNLPDFLIPALKAAETAALDATTSYYAISPKRKQS